MKYSTVHSFDLSMNRYDIHEMINMQYHEITNGVAQEPGFEPAPVPPIHISIVSRRRGGNLHCNISRDGRDFPRTDTLREVELPLPVEAQHVLEDPGRPVKEELPADV
jgi:hypothetical protein